MRLHPNPPRLITVAIALALGIVGLAVAVPIDALQPVLGPASDVLAQVGLTLDQELAFLMLFACPTLLVIGSLVPGI